MNLTTPFFLTFLIVLCTACQPKKENKKIPVANTTNHIEIADEIINKAIEAHGGKNYENTLYSFEFRGNEYSFINKESSYTYTVKNINGENKTLDVLNNGEFIRTINGIPSELTSKESSKYSSALNSVIYFALLPYKLNDTAVNKTDKGTVIIKGENYHAIQVTFNQKGGGEDHQDIFYYWVNTQSNTVDYLAYKYDVNGGGIRFREAYNTRNVNKVLFQDYINYKAPARLNLGDVPALFNEDKLVEVSRIELINVKN